MRAVVDRNGFRGNLTFYDAMQRQKILSCNSEKRGMYVIDPYGDVYLCFFTAGQKEFCAGTIGEKGSIEWDRTFYEIMGRNPLTFPECRECTILPMCGGGCYVRAYKQRSTYTASHCGSIKELAAERIKLYLRQKYPQKFGGLF